MVLVPREIICLYWYYFTVSDLGLPYVCHKETSLCIGPMIVIPFHLHCSSSHLFSCLSFFCFTLFSCSCVYSVVSPVLTPPESEKADSEDRVSLKVCVSIFSLSFKSFSWKQNKSTLTFLFQRLMFGQTPKRVEVHSIHTYVALYKFLPQENNDLELQSVKYSCALIDTVNSHHSCCQGGWVGGEGQIASLISSIEYCDLAWLQRNLIFV